jgi:hypothetical protein
VAFVGDSTPVYHVLLITFDDRTYPAVANHGTSALITDAGDRFSLHGEMWRAATDDLSAMGSGITDDNYLGHDIPYFSSASRMVGSTPNSIRATATSNSASYFAPGSS